VDGLNDQYPAFLVGDPAAPQRATGYFLSRFLIKAPALEHLRLNFQTWEMTSTEKLLLWLAGTPRTADTTEVHETQLVATGVRLTIQITSEKKTNSYFPEGHQSSTHAFPTHAKLPKFAISRDWYGICAGTDTACFVRQV
jgi:hypothetical protein